MSSSCGGGELRGQSLDKVRVERLVLECWILIYNPRMTTDFSQSRDEGAKRPRCGDRLTNFDAVYVPVLR